MAVRDSLSDTEWRLCAGPRDLFSAGSTLTEWLAVIAMIATLAALLLPTLARTMRCLNELTQSYGMNARLSVNKTTRAGPPPPSNTRLDAIARPAETIFVAGVDGAGAQALIPRSNRRGQFALCDASARALLRNDFIRTAAEANSASEARNVSRSVHWCPTATTPN